jgi:6-pyruvoyl-tetrahydropterin synthase
METTICTQPAEISIMVVRLPPFWEERPAVWFAQVEAQFVLVGISDKRKTFRQIISQLDHQYLAEVEDIIISPPKQDPYTKLWTELLNWLSPSREQRVSQLLTPEAMGEVGRPSSWDTSEPSPRDVPDYFLRTIWTSRLPHNIQTTLAAQPDIQFNTAAHCADRITEAISRPALASIGQQTDNAKLVKHIEELSRWVEALSNV